jgi:hypothetical protein
VIKLRLQGVRDLRAALVQVAAALAERPAVREACLLVRLPRISPARLAREWNLVRGLFIPSIAGRLALAVMTDAGPWAAPERAHLLQLAGVLHPDRPDPDRPERAARPAPSAKFFEVFKVLLEAWLRGAGPLSIGELLRRCGCSYPTAAAALRRLEEAGEAQRRSRRRVELRQFPSRTWAELVALAASIRGSRYFADRSGRLPDPAALLKRLRLLAPAGVAVGGVPAARRLDPRFDLNGTPRIDICAHAPGGEADFGWVANLDPALRPVPPPAPGAVLAVHLVRRPETLYTPDGRRGLPWADPVEILLDLHDLRLTAQADRLIACVRGRPLHE